MINMHISIMIEDACQIAAGHTVFQNLENFGKTRPIPLQARRGDTARLASGPVTI
jgi:hypothetical protein